MSVSCTYHVHEDGSSSFRCSNPCCEVSKDRLKKYKLLQSKENKVIEKYEKAIQIHDTIAKRRQSVHGTRPNSIVNEKIEEKTDEVVKLRRLSVPVKQRPKRSHLKPPTLSRLETVSDDELDMPIGRTSSSSILKSSIRKISVTPTPSVPGTKSSQMLTKRFSKSLDDMISPLAINDSNNKYSVLRRSTGLPPILASSSPIPRRKRIVLPSQQRYLEAKRKYEIRKSLLTSLDMDIHKVTLILRNLQSKSIPGLLKLTDKKGFYQVLGM